MEALPQILEAVRTGGDAALVLCVVFLIRAEGRLARIEKAFEIYIEEMRKWDIRNGVKRRSFTGEIPRTLQRKKAPRNRSERIS